MPINIISAKNIKKSYGVTEILHGVSLDVKQGEVNDNTIPVKRIFF